jgi:curved DNA-binding protein CbpA
MVHAGSLINIPYAQIQGDYGPLPSTNPILPLALVFIIKIIWRYTVWQPWLPINLLALVAFTSATLQDKVPILHPSNIWYYIITGGIPRFRLAKMLPLTVYLFNGRWKGLISFFLPSTCLLLFTETARRTYGDERYGHIEGLEQKQQKMSTSISTLNFLFSVFNYFQPIENTSQEIYTVVVFVILWSLLFFTRLGNNLEKFIQWIPLPNIDDLVYRKVFGSRGGAGRGGGGGTNQAQQQQNQTGAPAGPSSSSSEAIPVMMNPLPIPVGATPMVCSILAATNHYSVLGMPSPSTATEEALRKAKRTLSLATHPDKAGGAPGASDACQRVLEAADVLLNTEKRKLYDEEIALAKFQASGMAIELQEEFADIIFAKTGVDITQKDYIMVACDCCDIKAHQANLVPDRTPASARYCAQHKTRHAVTDNESWIEKEFAWDGWLPGSVFKYYTCFQEKIYDCSAAAECSGLLQIWARSGMEANSHENYYSKVVSSATAGSGGGGRNGKSGGGKNTSGAGGSSSTTTTTTTTTTNSKSKSKKGKKGRR